MDKAYTVYSVPCTRINGKHNKFPAYACTEAPVITMITDDGDGDDDDGNVDNNNNYFDGDNSNANNKKCRIKKPPDVVFSHRRG